GAPTASQQMSSIYSVLLYFRATISRHNLARILYPRILKYPRQSAQDANTTHRPVVVPGGRLDWLKQHRTLNHSIQDIRNTAGSKVVSRLPVPHCPASPCRAPLAHPSLPPEKSRRYVGCERAEVLPEASPDPGPRVGFA